MNLTKQEQQYLLNLARTSIQSNFSKAVTEDITTITSKLKKTFGVFVTLHTKNNQLRGCIGNIIGQYPLYIGVKKMAIQSAFHDPRFHPVTQKEVDDLRIEISVLSELNSINYNDITVGTHGLLIKHNFSYGVFLPQVPVEQGWDKTEYLEGLCRKADLFKDAYKDPKSQLLAFTTTIFSE